MVTAASPLTWASLEWTRESENTLPASSRPLLCQNLPDFPPRMPTAEIQVEKKPELSRP
jgi:hypothetical protein